jgi:anaerobic selenocysteine-containing dehydrogenase
MIARPGAGLLPLRGHSNVQGIGTIGVKPVLSPAVREAIQASLDVTLPTYSASPGLDTLSCLQRAHNGEMEAALLMGGNLYSATPHTAWAGTALDRIGFKLFLTTTLNAGHVHTCDNSDALILPVLARDEEIEPTTQESMFNYVRLSDGGIQRIAKARSEVSVLAELGQGILRKTGAERAEIEFCRFQRHDKVRDTIAEVVPGMERLRDINRSKTEFHITGRILHQPQFKTDNGKARFVVAPNPSMSEQGDFMLTSVRSEGQFNSIVYEEHDSYRGVSHRWVVFMNPNDIQQLGLSGDDRVNIHSDTGAMLDLCPVAFDIPLSNVMVYYPEANCLVGLEQDQRSKTPAFKSVRVRIEKSM